VKQLLAFSLEVMNGEDVRELIEKHSSAVTHVTPYDMLKLEDR